MNGLTRFYIVELSGTQVGVMNAALKERSLRRAIDSPRLVSPSRAARPRLEQLDLGGVLFRRRPFQ
jgi:hypothetical protein